jgi:DNA gyrase subunit B
VYTSASPKLEACRRRGPGCELYIVEGDSAAGAVCRVRDAQFQAVLPMQGKPMNAIKAKPESVRSYPLFAALIAALGGGAGDDFNLEKLHYERIILLMDPDADGIHCGMLMLMFFYRCMRPLLAQERLLLAQAPMASISAAALEQPHHPHTDAEFRNLCAQLRARGIDDFQTVRYRGLAGIDQPTLAHTCVYPGTRRVRTLSVADAEAAIAVFGGVA